MDRKFALFGSILFLINLSLSAQEKTDFWLDDYLRQHASPFLKNVLNKPDSFQYQIIYTKIDRDKRNNHHFWNY